MVLTLRTDAPRDRWGNALLGIALLLPLLLVVVILVHARRSEQAQRELADRALEHYAAVAAWQLATRIGTEYHNHIEMATRSLPPGSMMDHVPSPVRRDSTDCNCEGGADIRVAFRYTPSTGSLDILRGAPDSATRALLVRVAEAAATSTETEPHRVVFNEANGVAHAVSIFVRQGDPLLVYGAESDPGPYRGIIERVLATQPLLPPQLLAPPYTARELTVRIADTSGFVLLGSRDMAWSALRATDSVPRLAHLRVGISIAPTVADALIIGGLPRARTVPLIGVLVLATLLAAAAFLQHRRARELTRMRTEFMASVSHELRTPLTQISMFGETLMLGRERSEGERRHFAAIIHREAARLGSLVENVMRFTRGGSKRFALRLEVRRLADEIEQAIAAFQPIADAAATRMVATLDAEIHASVDPGAMRQIILNLLDNSVKYGPEGQRIDVSLSRDGAQALLTIADQGPGVPDAERERIFQPFVRLESRPRRVAGTGIGLAVVRELATALGGTVSVSDAPAGGALFTVRLPIVAIGLNDRDGMPVTARAAGA